MTYTNNKEAAIALCETMQAEIRQNDNPITLCVVKRRGRYDVVPLAAAKHVLGDYFLTDFTRIEWVALTGQEGKC
jgi:hypothetical protein